MIPENKKLKKIDLEKKEQNSKLYSLQKRWIACLVKAAQTSVRHCRLLTGVTLEGVKSISQYHSLGDDQEMEKVSDNKAFVLYK